MTIFTFEHHRRLGELHSAGRLPISPGCSIPPALSVPERYRIPSHEGTIFYRGDLRHCEQRGFYPRMFSTTAQYLSLPDHADCGEACCAAFEKYLDALRGRDFEAAFKHFSTSIAQGGEKFIHWVIDRHTDCVPWSPFLSVTRNPKLAQMYAPHSIQSTIYELSIPRERILWDCDDIGRSGVSGEFLVYGALFPSHILRLKTDNSLQHSELALPGQPHLIAREVAEDDSTKTIRDAQFWRPAM